MEPQIINHDGQGLPYWTISSLRAGREGKMKVRSGFVSNSSSSSFTAFMRRKDFDAMLASLGPMEQALMEHWDVNEGMDGFITFTFMVGNCDDFEWMEKEPIIETAKEKGATFEDEDDPYEELYVTRDNVNSAVCQLVKQGKAMASSLVF